MDCTSVELPVEVDVIEEYRDRLIVSLVKQCGMKSSQIIDLRVRDFDGEWFHFNRRIVDRFKGLSQ